MAKKLRLEKIQANAGEIEESIQFRYGSKILSIGKYDAPFFRKLQSLPADLKIQMMCISAIDMKKYIASTHKERKEKALHYLNKEWFSKEFGDPAQWYAEVCEMSFGIKMDREIIIKKMATRVITLEMCEAIISYFESSEKEVYSLDERE